MKYLDLHNPYKSWHDPSGISLDNVGQYINLPDLKGILDLHKMLGKSSKHIPQMVVKNGDESHGRIRKKITN